MINSAKHYDLISVVLFCYLCDCLSRTKLKNNQKPKKSQYDQKMVFFTHRVPWPTMLTLSVAIIGHKINMNNAPHEPCCCVTDPFQKYQHSIILIHVIHCIFNVRY